MKAAVFLGPTLPRRDAEAVLPAQYLPPVQQGDVYRLVRDHAPRCIGIIDGVFLHVASVWHREILWALSHGVHVFGAASMGALRAAELAPFGMRGVGRIQQAYRDGRWPGYDEPFEDDDEVAVIHAPVEAGGMALSDAMVDLRDTLLAAEAAGVIDREQREALTEAMKRLHFRDRSFAQLAELAAGTALAEWLADNIVRRKRLDALEMLQEMARFLATDPPPSQPDFRFERALVWEQFVAEANTPDAAEELALSELRLDPKAWHDIRRVALGRLHPAQQIDTAAERRQVERFRQERDLWRRAELDAWLAANALDVTRLEHLLRREASLDHLARQGGAALRAAMLDQLRLTGRFAALWQAAASKAAALATAPPPPQEPHRSAVLDWYIEQHLGMRRPASLTAFIDELGWASEDDFVLAVWREYLFNRAAK